MDKTPFLEFNLSVCDEADATNLKRFTKGSFNVDDSIGAARTLKYTAAIKRVLLENMKAPHESFVRFVLGQVRKGHKTKALLDEFRDLTRQAFQDVINERIQQRLQIASEREDAYPGPDANIDPVPEPEPEPKRRRGEVETTPEELEAFEVVKRILSGSVGLERIVLHDLPSYCNINLDGESRKNIVRLEFGVRKKYVKVRDESNRWVRHPVDSPEDIHRLAEEICARVARLL